MISDLEEDIPTSKSCVECKGTGACNTCQGRGYVTRESLTGEYRGAACECARGRCKWCRGSGRLPVSGEFHV